MIRHSAAIFAALTASSFAAEVRSGNATAEWITTSANYQAGQPVYTALRLKIDPGWHTYWVNPGEGGMKASFKWQLPEGWKVDEPQYPVPIRFFTGDLPGFGYENEVILPVRVTPPAKSTEAADLSVKISWLTCDDSACVPGDAEVTLHLVPGEPAATDDDTAINSAIFQVPKTLQGAVLKVEEKESVLTLNLKVPPFPGFDATKCEVFPKSVSTVDDGKPIQFTHSEDGWTATATKSEYLEGPVKDLTIVLAGKGTPFPMELTWKSE